MTRPLDWTQRTAEVKLVRRSPALLLVLLLEALSTPNPMLAATITPESGNGPFADGSIARRVGTTTTYTNWGDYILVGDDSGEAQENIYRGLLGFDLSSLLGVPAANATLWISSFQGDASIGSVLVDLVDFGDLLGGLEDYDVSAIEASIASFSATQIGYQSVDVTDAVNSSLASGVVQFRLRGQIEQSMPGQNLVFFNDVEDSWGTGEIPMLVVTPIPEPATALLLASSLAYLAVRRRLAA
jgi:hypothetical protein